MWLYLGKILSSKTTIKIIINKMNEPSLPGQLKQMLKKSPQDSGNWQANIQLVLPQVNKTQGQYPQAENRCLQENGLKPPVCKQFFLKLPEISCSTRRYQNQPYPKHRYGIKFITKEPKLHNINATIISEKIAKTKSSNFVQILRYFVICMWSHISFISDNDTDISDNKLTWWIIWLRPTVR